MTILVATTLAGFAMDDPDTWGAWLRGAEALRESVDVPVEFFAAIETDARGLDPFHPLTDVLAYLANLGGDYDPWWTFDLDDGRSEVTTANRLRHLTLGQNLCAERAASDVRVSHLLFMAADTMAPHEVLPKLLETGHPYIGPRIDTYGTVCRGPVSGGWPAAWQVEDAMPSAACILLHRDVFTRLRFRVDAEHGMTDDPAYQYDARELLGIRSAVRADIVARHFPEAIGPIETRGHDMRVYR